MRNREVPALSVFLFVLGLLNLAGGVTMGVMLLPGTPEIGYRWLATAYIPSLTWLSVGVVGGMLLFAAAAVVAYLAQIRTQTEGADAKLLRIEELLGQALAESSVAIRPTSPSTPDE